MLQNMDASATAAYFDYLQRVFHAGEALGCDVDMNDAIELGHHMLYAPIGFWKDRVGITEDVDFSFTKADASDYAVAMLHALNLSAKMVAEELWFHTEEGRSALEKLDEIEDSEED